MHYRVDIALLQAITAPCSKSLCYPLRRSAWAEHLRAIREGKLELLNAETTYTYTYEVICKDGTKRIFFSGGGEDPLKRSRPLPMTP